MTKRYYVVEHTFRVVHSYENRSVPEPELDSLAEYFFTEGTCSDNVVNELAAVVEKCQNYCATCHGHEAKMIGAFETEEATFSTGAIVLNTNSSYYKDLDNEER